LVTGVDAQFSKNQITVYPNPVTSKVHIDGLEVGSVVQLIDNTGRVILSKQVSTTTDVLDVVLLKKGVYFLKISFENETGETKRLIID